MSLTLTKDHAIIHTATIDVKIMRLNKRQVTMAVFRQLDAESIFNSNGTLAGKPWGRVNYTWKDSPRGTAFHIVWQDGDSIKRSAVPRDIWGPDSWLRDISVWDTLQSNISTLKEEIEHCDSLCSAAKENNEAVPRSLSTIGNNNDLDFALARVEDDSTFPIVEGPYECMVLEAADDCDLTDNYGGDFVKSIKSWDDLRLAFDKRANVDLKQLGDLTSETLAREGFITVEDDEYTTTGNDDNFCRGLYICLIGICKMLQEKLETYEQRQSDWADGIDRQIDAMRELDQLFIAT